MKEFKSLKEAQDAFDNLSTENSATLEQNKSLTETNDALSKEVLQKNADIDELNTIIKDLRTSTPSVGGQKAFEFGGKVKVITADKFKFGREEYTADDVLKNKDLQAALVKGKVGFIVDAEELEEKKG